jgi:hypothetical protein
VVEARVPVYLAQLFEEHEAAVEAGGFKGLDGAIVGRAHHEEVDDERGENGSYAVAVSDKWNGTMQECRFGVERGLLAYHMVGQNLTRSRSTSSMANLVESWAAI